MRENNNKRAFVAGGVLLLAFAVWTWMVRHVDVQSVGVHGTAVGFASLNVWFHELTGVHMSLYTITDWLGLVPLAICLCFGTLGMTQLVRRGKITRVDSDIIILGVYYIAVIFAYLIFEMIPINYRPILIDGYSEASYPSSTTLLVFSVMPTLSFQMNRRFRNKTLLNAVAAFCILFSAFMVIGRLISGVHWCTDIIGAVLLSIGMFMLYRASVGFADENADR